MLLAQTMYKNELEFGEFVGTEWPLFIMCCGFVPLLVLALISALKRQKGTAK